MITDERLQELIDEICLPDSAYDYDKFIQDVASALKELQTLRKQKAALIEGVEEQIDVVSEIWNTESSYSNLEFVVINLKSLMREVKKDNENLGERRLR